MKIPTKFRRYPFVTWVFALATIVTLLYVGRDIFGPDAMLAIVGGLFAP